jgi:hypothetical protein
MKTSFGVTFQMKTKASSNARKCTINNPTYSRATSDARKYELKNRITNIVHRVYLTRPADATKTKRSDAQDFIFDFKSNADMTNNETYKGQSGTNKTRGNGVDAILSP